MRYLTLAAAAALLLVGCGLNDPDTRLNRECVDGLAFAVSDTKVIIRVPEWDRLCQ